MWFSILVEGLEGEILDVLLDCRVRPLASDQPLSIENCVFRIRRQLILGGVTDKPFVVGERHVGRRNPVALVVGDDLHTSVLHYTHTKEGEC